MECQPNAHALFVAFGRYGFVWYSFCLFVRLHDKNMKIVLIVKGRTKQQNKIFIQFYLMQKNEPTKSVETSATTPTNTFKRNVNTQKLFKMVQ